MDSPKDTAGSGEQAANEPNSPQSKPSNSNDSEFFDQLGSPKDGSEPATNTETTEPTPVATERPSHSVPEPPTILEVPPTPFVESHPHEQFHENEPEHESQPEVSHIPVHTTHPSSMPHLDSDNNMITTCHIEDISVGCLKCQAKSAERLAMGQPVNWETIHQQHLHESEEDSEGGLEMPIRRPSQPNVGSKRGPGGLDGAGPADAEDESGDVPDTKDIGFTPESLDQLGVTEDPFEKLRRDSITHTSSFPIVPDPQSASAEPPSNPFENDSTADDSFFGNATKEEKPVEPSDSNFFGDEGHTGEDFFASVNANSEPSKSISLERSETSDLVMGGNVTLESGDNRFSEGMPLFGDQGATDDDFFSRSKTPIDPTASDDEASFFDNPTALKRKSTAIASGLPDIVTPAGEENATENKPKDAATSKWAAAFDDDDDLFAEEEEETAAGKKSAAWFDDNDDFLLEGDEDKASVPAPATPSQAVSQPAASRYQPSQPTSQHAQFKTNSPSTSHSTASAYAAVFNPAPPRIGDTPKAQSFVDKTSGYASPYDLPEDIVKPMKKKPTPVQQPPAYGSGHYYGAPTSSSSAHSGSMFSPGPPSSLGSPADIRGRSGYAGQPGPPPGPPARGGASPAPNAQPQKALKPSSGFFEELPMTMPKRPPSSTSARYTPGPRIPSGGAPTGPPPTSAPISMNRQSSFGPPSRPTSVEPGYASSPVGSLGTPHQYGTSPALAHSPLARATSQYTPAPTSNYPAKPTPNTSYAPPPGNSVRGSSPYAQRPAGPPASLSRASTMPNDGVGLGLSGQNEKMTNGHVPTGRPPSRDRPGSMESIQGHALGGVAEEDETGGAPASHAFNKALPPPPVAATNNRYNPASRRTPPPHSVNPALSNIASPPNRIQSPSKYTPANYQTHTANSSISSSVLSPSDAIGGFAPPKRSATQSPGFAAFKSSAMGIPRPSSAAAPATAYSNTYSPVEVRRPSFPHQNSYPTPAPPPQNFIAPPPGSLAATDPLERWKGSPLFYWGFGGNIVTMIPVHTSRWNTQTGQEAIKSSIGEVKIRPAKDVLKGDEFLDDLAKFPGPVFGGRSGGKGRKKEISAWMETKILKLEGEYTRHRDPRSMEKVILWKIVKLCLENDGMLVGKPEVEAAVRQIISPESDTLELPRVKNALQQSTVFDRNALDVVRTHLMKGDREAAVWFAIENRQWAHAILISSTTSPELYKRAVQEFVKQEVKSIEGVERPGMESLAVLYEVFAGNWEESIDDLVPASTRMGMTMMSTTGGQAVGNSLEGLEKWRETLGLMLSNRSNNDIQAIAKLGSLLESYNRIEAAHICYLFSLPAATFSGAEETSKTIFALLGANHVNNPFNYGRDLDAIILSEIYEFALSLVPGAPTLTNIPHLLPFKLHHATILAQYGFKTEATKYTEAITASFKVTTRPQPYLHPVFLSTLDELTNRLSQAPRDSNGGSLISKTTLDNISGSLFDKFNRFVTGDSDDKDTAKAGGVNGGINDGSEEQGPFARLATSAEINRVNSEQNLYGIGTGGYTPYNPAQPPLGTTPVGMMKPSSAAGRYAPKTATGGGGAYTPQPTQTKPADPATPSYGGYGGYEPSPSYGGYGSYEPSPQQTPYQSAEKPAERTIETPNGYPGYQPSPALQTAPPMSPPSLDSGYSTFSPPTASTTTTDEAAPSQSGGYEAPSYGGYEPPTAEFQPYVPTPDNSDNEGEGKEKKSKPKKKGIMDDDDDLYMGAGGGSSNATKKKKEEEEEENRKMVAAIAKKEQEEAEKKKKAAAGGGWLSGWFGGAKKDPNAKTVYSAKLGEENSFYYDPDSKRWVNKKAGSTDSAGITPSGTPPPPRRLGSPAQIGPPSGPPSNIGSPRPGTSSSMESLGGPPKPLTSAPPTSAPTLSPGGLMPPAGPPSATSRDPSPNRPPPRPATTGKVDEMEELLGGGTGSVRKPAAKAKGRKRYVEVL
ncbi:vesicle coat component [Orbilia ellipsospora]|uniref:Protein transport protein sec16 n=1 Tax=Orbilia ellipsospora TaxID=2528407 RepID=A0AAV9XJS6_9PEZI